MLGGAGLIWDLWVSANIIGFLRVGATSVSFGYFQPACQAGLVDARDKARGSVWNPVKNFFIFFLQTGRK